jgi:hypothetical protein
MDRTENTVILVAVSIVACAAIGADGAEKTSLSS